MFVLVIIGYAFLIIFEFIPLFKQKIWRDFWTNTIIGIISFSMAILLSFNIKIPSPAKPIADWITSILGK